MAYSNDCVCLKFLPMCADSASQEWNNMHDFMVIAKFMAPLLVLMLCPIWLPLLGTLIGVILDRFRSDER